MLEKTNLGNDCYKRFIEMEIKRQEEHILGLRGQLKMAEEQLRWLHAELSDES